MIIALISTLLHLTTTQAQDLPGFNYRVTDVGSHARAQELFNSMVTQTRGKSICSNRAHLWAYDLYRFDNIYSGKVFLHYTDKTQFDDNKEWAYHVAPYIMIKGEEYVMDAGFIGLGRKPRKMDEWLSFFAKTKKCVVLDPIQNPNHLAMEQRNLPNDTVNPLNFRNGGARRYPSKEGLCFIRKVPMYFQWPVEVYGNDLFQSGKTEYAKFALKDFSKSGVLNACQQATTLGFRLNQSCADYLGFSLDFNIQETHPPIWNAP